jgi:dGTPase
MENKFYNQFDKQCLLDREPNYRTIFQQDRDRIIYSFAFRRLQAKTQVFMSGEYDFYRTRLTHSIEVSQIGRSICNYLSKQCPDLNEEYYIDPDLVEATCLTHDIGHPPFGHAGESLLNDLMLEYGGFEGNAQTLRIMTETISTRLGVRQGMNPSRAFMDGVLKYKSLHSQLENPENHFLYNEQSQYLDYVFKDRKFPESLIPGKSLNKFRSIECQIMDWADDTAYSLNDMVDSIKVGFLSYEKIEKWATEQKLDEYEIQLITNILKMVKEGNIDVQFSAKIGEFIEACNLKEQTNFMSDLTNRYHYLLTIKPEIAKECELYKRLSLEVVFNSPQLKQLVFKGHFMLRRIFNAFMENYLDTQNPKLRLLPKDFEKALLVEESKIYRARMICDYIAGMTDRFAVRLYRRLYEPDFGSIVDLV